MYKVFINNKSIFIGEKNQLPAPSEHDTIIDNATNIDILMQILIFENNEQSPQLFLYGKPEKIIKHFVFIKAAGGLVVNDKGDLLFIFRNGKWDLPKGKVETGEQIKHAAIREVEEECSVSGLVIKDELPPTYHTYVMNNQRYLKITYWFIMHCSNFENAKPQISENITCVKWLKADEVKNALQNSFSSIVETIENYNRNIN